MDEFLPSELVSKLCLGGAGKTKRIYSEVRDENDDITIMQTDIMVTDELGITFVEKKKGDMTEQLDNCFPFLDTDVISSREETSVESKIDYLASFIGATDDVHFGVTMIYRLRNIVEFLRTYSSSYAPMEKVSVSVSGLSVGASIVLPIHKTPMQKQEKINAELQRVKLMHAARSGDQSAMRELNQQEMKTYFQLWQRIQFQSDDILSVVESSFIPYGAECELFTVLGDIEEVREVTNPITDEVIFVMKVICNGVPFRIAINRRDLEGEPAVGRRFKGPVWLQGKINFPASGTGNNTIYLTED